jgi:hypothetical protein
MKIVYKLYGETNTSSSHCYGTFNTLKEAEDHLKSEDPYLTWSRDFWIVKVYTRDIP